MHAVPPARTGLLTGRRGWTTVAALAGTLVLVVGAQLPAVGAAQASGPAAAARSVERDRPVAAVVAARAAAAVRPAPPAPAPAAVPLVAAPAPEAAPAAAPAATRTAARTAAPAAAPAPASAPPPAPADLCGGAGWQQRRGAAALASLGPGAGSSGFRVQFSPARSGYMGLTYLQRGVVEVFVRDCARQSDQLLRHVMAHELGHAFDTARMTDATRTAWKAARGIPASTPWYGCSGCADFASPAGDFAEVYAQWLRGASSNRSQLAGDVAPAALPALAARFFRA